MATRAILALACLSLATAAVIQTHSADKTFLSKQKDIFNLLWHPGQPEVVWPEFQSIATSYSIEQHREDYNDQNAVTEFLQRYNEGLLPRGELFSLMYEQQRDEALIIFRLLYSAKQYNTFYNTAVWARFNVNEVMFAYVLCVAVIQRPDTQGIQLPPIYEMIPSFFFDTEIIQQAEQYKMTKDPNVHEEHIIPVNYTELHSIYDTEPETKLHYFTNDIGLNTFYFYLMNEFPVFLTSQEMGVPTGIRGEQYLYDHKQLMVRYYLERLSNGLGEIESFDWNRQFQVGYYPTISLPNGVAFPERKPWSLVPIEKYGHLQEVQDIESRIWMAINSGYILNTNFQPVDIYSSEGLNILGNIIQGNADSMNSHLYGSVVLLARKILGFNAEPVGKYPIHPSVLEYYSTSLRDPAFYLLFKRIVNFYLQYKSHLPAYTHEELVFSGVTIEQMSVDKLITYFEDFDALIGNSLGVYNQADAEQLIVKARQPRLNHKPFNYHIKINSDKNTNAMIRIFLGPKYDENHHVLNITDNYMNFLEIDHFDVKLKVGSNLIERNSQESVYVVPDQTPSRTFMENVMKSMKTGEPFTYENRRCGFPQRLLLPKGTTGGMLYQMFVYVSQYEEAQMSKYESTVWGTTYSDGKPMGFPLDRPVYGFNFTVPNMYFKDVTIYHQELEELNLTI